MMKRFRNTSNSYCCNKLINQWFVLLLTWLFVAVSYLHTNSIIDGNSFATSSGTATTSNSLLLLLRKTSIVTFASASAAVDNANDNDNDDNNDNDSETDEDFDTEEIEVNDEGIQNDSTDEDEVEAVDEIHDEDEEDEEDISNDSDHNSSSNNEDLIGKIRVIDYYLTACEIFNDSIIRVALSSLREQQRQRKLLLKRRLFTKDENDVEGDNEDSTASVVTIPELDTRLYDHAIKNCYYNPFQLQHELEEEDDDGSSSRSSSYKNFGVTLTLCGYKGGKQHEQINQDRAFVLSLDQSSTVLSGVLDGHGNVGHYVAEWARNEIIKQIRRKYKRIGTIIVKRINIQNDAMATSTMSTNTNNTMYQDRIPELLHQVMVETDKSMPNNIAIDGGATASLVLQDIITVEDGNGKDDGEVTTTTTTAIYFCNAGDSQSFLMASIVIPTLSKDGIPDVMVVSNLVIFATRLDKPDIPEEKERIEKVPGMKVTANKYDDGDDARVWYKTSKNHSYGLAMSRALGDREATAVIADPIITTFYKDTVIHDIVTRVNSGDIIIGNSKRHTSSKSKQQEQECEIVDPMNPGVCQSSSSSSTSNNNRKKSNIHITEQNVKLFIVSATDGIIDYIQPQQLADSIGPSIFAFNSGTVVSTPIHPIIATENIIHDATAKWNQDLNGEYRDDMAISITTVI